MTHPYNNINRGLDENEIQRVYQTTGHLNGYEQRRSREERTQFVV